MKIQLHGPGVKYCEIDLWDSQVTFTLYFTHIDLFQGEVSGKGYCRLVAGPHFKSQYRRDVQVSGLQCHISLLGNIGQVFRNIDLIDLDIKYRFTGIMKRDSSPRQVYRRIIYYGRKSGLHSDFHLVCHIGQERKGKIQVRNPVGCVFGFIKEDYLPIFNLYVADRKKKGF